MLALTVIACRVRCPKMYVARASTVVDEPVWPDTLQESFMMHSRAAFQHDTTAHVLCQVTWQAHRAPIPEEEPLPGDEPLPEDDPVHPDPVVREPREAPPIHFTSISQSNYRM